MLKNVEKKIPLPYVKKTNKQTNKQTKSNLIIKSKALNDNQRSLFSSTDWKIMEFIATTAVTKTKRTLTNEQIFQNKISHINKSFILMT